MSLVKKYDDLSFLEKCGCYSCRKIFSTNLINETTSDDLYDEVAICPFCDNATVIGDSDQIISENKLNEVKKTEQY